MKPLALIALFFTLSACAFTDVNIQRAIDAGQIRIGMDRFQVAKITTEPLSFCKKSRLTNDGLVELWDFATRLCGANLMQSYALVFKNGLLTEIRTVRGPLDLQLP